MPEIVFSTKEPPLDLAKIASQIFDDILHAASTSELTEYTTTNGVRLTRGDLVEAIHGALAVNKLVAVPLDLSPDEPIRSFMLRNKNTQEIAEVGIIIDQNFLLNSTPDSVSRMIKEGKIDPWKIVQGIYAWLILADSNNAAKPSWPLPVMP